MNLERGTINLESQYIAPLLLQKKEQGAPIWLLQARGTTDVSRRVVNGMKRALFDIKKMQQYKLRETENVSTLNDDAMTSRIPVVLA